MSIRQLSSSFAFAAVASTLNLAIAGDWAQTSAPTNSWSAVATSADGTKITAVAQGNVLDGQIYLSVDAGVTWQPASAPPARWDSVASSADGMKLVASGTAGVWTSGDFGFTWVLRTNVSFRSLASSADGARLVGAGAGGFNIYTSTNSGAFWSPVSGVGTCVASSADGTKLVTAYFAYPGFLLGGIFTSTDAGLTWRQTSAPLDLTTGWNSLASSAEGKELAATIGYTDWPTGPGRIYASRDGGDTWHATGSPVSFWNSIACSADGIKLVAGGSLGVFTSLDSGTNWTWNTNVPSGLRTWVASSTDGNKLVAAVNGGGIWIWAASLPPIRSPVEAVEDLIHVVENSALPPYRQHPLLESLQAAATAFERGQTGAGVNQLHAFENKVEAQVARLHPILAQQLTDSAETIVTSLTP